jgi:hypothetical protein
LIFLIEYNRGEGHLVTFKKYGDAQLREAQDERLAIELELHRKGIQHEVVLLEAESEETIRRTHRRYFETLRELLANSDWLKNGGGKKTAKGTGS